MITRKEEGDLIITRQIDHAAVSGELARHWGNEIFARPHHADSVDIACTWHDEAWRYLDEASPLNSETKRPHTFMDMPLDVILPAYLDGADRVGERDPYAGFLTMMHYQGFFNQRFGLDPSLPTRDGTDEETLVANFMARAEMVRGILRAKAAQTQRININEAHYPPTAHAYLILQVVDVISLFLCVDPTRDWPLGHTQQTIGGERTPIIMKSLGAHRLQVEPWPFVSPKEIEIQFPIRRIPDRDYDSSVQIQTVLHDAREESLGFRLCSE